MAFYEYMVKRKRTAADNLLSILCWIGAIIVSVVIAVFLLKFGGLALILIVGAFYGAHFLSGRMKKEFEYICTDDSLDIDVIMNRQRRKRLISFSMSQTEIIACVKDDRYNSEMNGSFDKVIDASSGDADANVYFAIVSKDGRTLVKFEPSVSILELLNKHARSKVHIY